MYDMGERKHILQTNILKDRLHFLEPEYTDSAAARRKKTSHRQYQASKSNEAPAQTDTEPLKSPHGLWNFRHISLLDSV